jgi:hypothetical protein
MDNKDPGKEAEENIRRGPHPKGVTLTKQAH